MKKLLVIGLSLLFVISFSFSLPAKSLNKKIGKAFNNNSHRRSLHNLSSRGRNLRHIARSRHHYYRPIRFKYHHSRRHYNYYTDNYPGVNQPYFGYGYSLADPSRRPENSYSYPGYGPPPQDISPYANLKNVKPAGEILVLVEPVNAKVWIDGQLIAQNEDTSFTFGVLTGQHHVKIMADGYTTFSENVFVPVGGIPIEVTLEKAGPG